MGLVSIPVGRGAATGIDPSLTEQLQEAIGVVYKVGDPAAHKFPGRTVFNDTPIAADNVDDVMFDGARILAVAGAKAYRSSPTTGAFTQVWDLGSPISVMDITTLDDIAYVTSGRQTTATDISTTQFGMFAMPSGSNAAAYRMGMAPVITAASLTLLGGGALPAGTYYYWVTEYDSTNGVESAFEFSPTAGSPYGTGAVQPAAPDKTRITFPTQRNVSATKWRIYRTSDGNVPPIGWLVAEVAIATLTYDDEMTDAVLILQDPYRIVSPSGIPESMDVDPQDLPLTSLTTFEGSLVGITADGVAWTPAGEPHSWPVTYRMQMPTQFGGRETCVRKSGDGCYVATKNELFRMNYLPDESDNVFSADIAVEHVANYGTPSGRGMCSFTAWGGAPVLFVASLQGPILCAGKVVDRAVKNIDWANLVNLQFLSSCKVIDNPDDYRVEVYYLTDNSPHTWECLHFYYDSQRATRTDGPLPEMAWTGPHPVPGPGCYAVASAGPKKFTAGDVNTDGVVYVENSGTVDAALLTDSDGTIPFSLTTQRVYPGGLDKEGRADRVFIHSAEQSDQDYGVTFTAYRENGQSKEYPNITIEATGPGLNSNGLNASHVSFAVTVNADGVDGMAPINNIHVRVEDPVKSLKTQVVNANG